jgi:hypothetical protein
MNQDSVDYQNWFFLHNIELNAKKDTTNSKFISTERFTVPASEHAYPIYPQYPYNHSYSRKPIRRSPWRKANMSKEAWAETQRLSLLSLGIGASYRRQNYDNEMMNLFKKVSSFSLDVDVGINDLIVTANFAWGGGQLYDSLAANYWEWLPYTKVSTTTSGVFIAYPAIDEAYGRISPFAGIQQMKLKLKPDFYMLTPVGLENILESKYVYSLGFHYDLIGYDYSFNGKFYNGFGLRFSYAWSIIQFDEFKGFMHQLTLGLYRSYRAVRPKSK